MRREVVIDGHFAVYEDGRVNRIVDGVEIPVQFTTGTGYKAFSYKRSYLVHRLIAETFIPNPDSKPVVNHKDGNKLNNSVENLEWVTVKENVRHAVDTGLKGNRPSKCYGKKKTGFYRARYNAGLTIVKAAAAIGVSPATICSWEYGKHKPHNSLAAIAARVYGCTVDDLIRKEATA